MDKQEPKKVLTEEDIFNQKDIDAVTDYINKEQQKQHLIDMMKDGEELGLYDDIKANRIELVCKDCSDSLEDCTCIISTIDLPKQEPKKVLTEEDIFNQKNIDAVTDYINKEQQKQHLIDMMESDEELELYDESREIKIEDIFNDEKRENIKKFIDEINNPSEPNDKLKQAFEKYSEYLEDYENKNTYEHGFKDGAKCQQEISYSEEEVIQLVSDWTDYRMSEDTKSKVTFKKWFEQFKKK